MLLAWSPIELIRRTTALEKLENGKSARPQLRVNSAADRLGNVNLRIE
jgi:hypothetical protein